MTINERLYNLRKSMGMSQKDFANKIGASQSAINYWENGKRQPRLEQLEKISKALNMTTSELMGLTTSDIFLGNVKFFYIILKHYRERFHLSQSELDDKLKMPHGTTKSIENIEASPTNDFINNAAIFFHVSWTELVDDYSGEIFRRIEKIRNYFKLSEAEFAEKINTVPDMYKNWKIGIKSYIEYLDLISERFDVPNDYLWLESDYCPYFEKINCTKIVNEMCEDIVNAVEKQQLLTNYDKLNTLGRSIANDRILELTEIKKYTEQ